MVSSPLLIGLEIQQPSGTVRANIQVVCRNENTNQSQILESNDSGEVIFNLGDTEFFSKGWNVGDRVSVNSLYLGFEQSFSLTIPALGTTISVKDKSGTTVGSFVGGQGITFPKGIFILIEKAVLPALRYYTPQEWLDYFNMVDTNTDSENGIDLLQLTRIGESVEQEIDSETNTKFDSNDGSFYSPSAIEGGESPEYHDAKYIHQNVYFTDFVPINTLTTFEINQVAEGGAPSWESITEADNEISVDKHTGRIKIINSGKYAETGARHVRITYVFGRSSVPKDIRMLAIVETGRRIMGSTFIKKKIRKFDETTFPDLNEFNTFRRRIIQKYKNVRISPT